MHPICFRVAGFPVHWYGVLMALGFFAGLANWLWLGRRKGWGFNFFSDLLFWVMVSAIFGARLAYVLANLETFSHAPHTVLYLHQGGLIYYGGLLGGIAAVVVFARVRHLELPALLDLVATSVPLGHAFGRLGCFLNGCCHGRLSDGPFSVTFPPDSLAWWRHVNEGLLSPTAARSLPVIPVQLYESAYNLLLYVALVLLYRRQPRPGTTAGVYLLLYPVGRFLLEFLRGDARARWLGLSVAQVVSLGLLAAGTCLLAWSRRKGRSSTKACPCS